MTTFLQRTHKIVIADSDDDFLERFGSPSIGILKSCSSMEEYLSLSNSRRKYLNFSDDVNDCLSFSSAKDAKDYIAEINRIGLNDDSYFRVVTLKIEISLEEAE